MKFREYKEALGPTDVAILEKDGKTFAVADINQQGGVCDCCCADGLECGGIGDCDLVMVKNIETHDIVFEPE